MSTSLTNPVLGTQISALLASGTFPIVASTISQVAGAQLTVGASLGQVSSLYAATLSVSSGSPVSIDLTALTDPVGNAINFARVQVIYIQNLGTVASPLVNQVLTVGGGTYPLSSDQYTVQLNGFITLENLNPGFVVVTSTTQFLKFTVASGTNVQIKVVIIGNLA